MDFSCKPVAYIYNSSYSGGRDQEEQGPKPAKANYSWDPVSKIINITLVPEAHTCNPSYSEGSDQEDHSSKPVLGK
jgi:hypothetical protein